ncbi:MAG: GIY-YIG nuclease family protein [Cyclobacteriaceae bacterium]
MHDINISSILNIDETNLSQYKLHLACYNGATQPLTEYLADWEKWIGWNQWRGGKNDFNREYIFSLIQFYHEPNKWLFGGIFRIVERHSDWEETNVGYRVELQDQYQEFIGRLIIDFTRYQGMRGRAFLLENFYADLTVSQILKRPYDGISFPGYENINIDFPELESIFKFQKNDWKAALKNVKGVYVIYDKSNGKKYVGSAYGEFGIWSRWSVYAGTGHGFNDELTKIIAENGIEYARNYFRFCLLEYRPARTDDSIIINREGFWKEALLSRNEFGYNSN